MFINRPLHYPGALPDETPQVINHLAVHGSLLRATQLNYDELEALHKMRALGYLRLASCFRYVSYAEWLNQLPPQS